MSELEVKGHVLLTDCSNSGLGDSSGAPNHRFLCVAQTSSEDAGIEP